jgi:hypothetical protein
MAKLQKDSDGTLKPVMHTEGCVSVPLPPANWRTYITAPDNGAIIHKGSYQCAF